MTQRVRNKAYPHLRIGFPMDTQDDLFISDVLAKSRYTEGAASF
jgi:hypothetical protein